ncbi:hypothetical protein TYRP_016336 [Tyrophagus putrescentiae]|nr:hypothetical protein TYRP_016336 [Tyrophagus putrescentiae]
MKFIVALAFLIVAGFGPNDRSLHQPGSPLAGGFGKKRAEALLASANREFCIWRTELAKRSTLSTTPLTRTSPRAETVEQIVARAEKLISQAKELSPRSHMAPRSATSSES